MDEETLAVVIAREHTDLAAVTAGVSGVFEILASAPSRELAIMVKRAAANAYAKRIRIIVDPKIAHWQMRKFARDFDWFAVEVELLATP
ncbi:hypothetical protein P8A24_01620 [Arcanobacterium wilhelmae]|uniref:hypothetical protein n=1 Tax=Arcanobacterium wilhelmae TaxID=1803177 RepID=UPI00241552C3|nr:hypothetical protein [Arcanobacterium wilhelmae]WFN90584.1 hypothetical protein P8A24_01620 [Arcanobacterium wilhelmae]